MSKTESLTPKEEIRVIVPEKYKFNPKQTAIVRKTPYMFIEPTPTEPPLVPEEPKPEVGTNGELIDLAGQVHPHPRLLHK